jgi:hypothetical protein
MSEVVSIIDIILFGYSSWPVKGLIERIEKRGERRESSLTVFAWVGTISAVSEGHGYSCGF